MEGLVPSNRVNRLIHSPRSTLRSIELLHGSPPNAVFVQEPGHFTSKLNCFAEDPLSIGFREAGELPAQAVKFFGDLT